jgi:hypothetical protein
MTPISYPLRRCPAARIPKALWLQICFTADRPGCKPRHRSVDSACAQKQRLAPAATWPAL